MSVVSGQVVAAGQLPPYRVGELPEPPPYRFRNVLAMIGPGAILLGLSIGSGEWLLGPAATVKWGLAMLWIVTISALLQVLLNTEMARYTLYTGEPIVTGFMRTWPGPRFWGWVYPVLYWLQVGWPGWAASAGGALAYIVLGQLPGPEHAGLVKALGYATLFAAFVIFLLGHSIERTLEYVNWFWIGWILVYLFLLDLFLVPGSMWWGAVKGFFSFGTIPEGADWFLLAAFAGYTGAGGMLNTSITNWLRDKGFGMGRSVGYIPAAIGGRRVSLSPTGVVFEPRGEQLARWRQWWRYLAADQYWLWCGGAFLGMLLPSMLAVSVIEPGKDIRGLGVGAAIADGVAHLTSSGVLKVLTAITGFWILYSTQVGIMDGFIRTVTDTLWAASERVRRWRGGDVRAVYYTVAGLFLIWACIAINLAQPIVLIQLSASIASALFVIISLHTLVVNRKLLPPELRPPLWRQAALVACALFFAIFAGMWLYGTFAR